VNESPVAVVTGASRGIGRAIAVALSRARFKVAGMSRPPTAGAPDALGTLEREIAAAGGTFLGVHLDVADLPAHDWAIDEVERRLGRVDVFVSNAGIAPAPRLDLLDMTPESFDRVVGVNLRGALFLAQRAARRMVEAPQAARWPRCLVFVTSVSAEYASPDRAEYCVSKAGLSMAARVFAARLAASGIAVFEVRPGIVRTDMTAPVREGYDGRIAAGLVPERRWGEPEDVARAVVSLARGDFPYATGTVVDVGGGLAVPRL
jgi:3-oxoacyl-[acyl-carrier protein] reductase